MAGQKTGTRGRAALVMGRAALMSGLLLAGGAAVSAEDTPAATAPAPAVVTTSFVGAGAADLGHIELRDAAGGVWFRYDLKGLTPGWHAMHFHATGDCSDEGFKKSGGHVNTEADKKSHGLFHPDGPDFGDLPNIHVGADGTAKGEGYTPFVTLSGVEGAANRLLDADGSAIVIHESADDHVTQPIGGAGARVGCAIISAAEAGN